jgi:hypothetical protein
MSTPAYRFLSLGAGVQSTTCLLLAAHGPTPTIDAPLTSTPSPVDIATTGSPCQDMPNPANRPGPCRQKGPPADVRP